MKYLGRQVEEKDIVASTNCPTPDVFKLSFDLVSNDTIIMYADTCQGSKNFVSKNTSWAAQTGLLFDVVK